MTENVCFLNMELLWYATAESHVIASWFISSKGLVKQLAVVQTDTRDRQQQLDLVWAYLVIQDIAQLNSA